MITFPHDGAVGRTRRMKALVEAIEQIYNAAAEGSEYYPMLLDDHYAYAVGDLLAQVEATVEELGQWSMRRAQP